MKEYYKHVFPYKEMFQWLAYGNDGPHAQADKTFTQRREICFTLDGDIFVRYKSYAKAEAMKDDLIEYVLHFRPQILHFCQISTLRGQLALPVAVDTPPPTLSFASHPAIASAPCRKCPSKIDIGPVYNRDPVLRKQYSDFTPVERELVFDIDMDGYDDVRICCQVRRVARSALCADAG